MKDWKKRKDEAEKAKKNCNNLEDIPINFDPLIQKYPKDAMVRYCRGESFEFYNDKRKAYEDYRFANKNFPKQEWKAKAEKKLKHCVK